MSATTDLAEMLCTRLCHDLTGPIGAVNNGVEFLEEEGFNLQHDAMQLISNSAGEAIHRLQFYRQTYGRINDGGEADLQEKRMIVRDFFANSKIQIDWPDAHAGGTNVQVGQRMARLLMNVLLIGASALIRGGTLAVRITENEAHESVLQVTAAGEVIKIEEDHQRILTGAAKVGQLTPKTVQLVLTRDFATEIDAKLQVKLADSQLEITMIKAPAATVLPKEELESAHS